MTYALPSHLRARVGVGSSAKRDKRQILEQAILPDACFAEVARRYGIAERVLFRWKQEATQAAAPMFVAVEVADGPLDATLGNEECAS
jgi:hypothetical protein